MKRYTLKCEQLVKRPLKEVFDFFQNPENLEKITPPSLGFVILTPRPIFMGKGLLIDYTIKILGKRLYWTTRIEDYQPPFFFSDSQLKGPYALWLHKHYFKETKEGVLIVDEVEYALPMGFLGRLANLLYVKHDLKRIFNYRKKIITEVFA